MTEYPIPYNTPTQDTRHISRPGISDPEVIELAVTGLPSEVMLWLRDGDNDSPESEVRADLRRVISYATDGYTFARDLDRNHGLTVTGPLFSAEAAE